MTGPDLTLRAISPDLAEILDAATVHDTDPAGIEAFTSEWMINEILRDDPSLTREQAIALARQSEREAAEGGL
jgi:hypothetical protein